MKEPEKLHISSSSFEYNGEIPPIYTCDGGPPAGGRNPPLTITNVPDGARSLVLVLDDPDTRIGTFVHWVVFNIPPGVTEIMEGQEPEGMTGKNSAGKTGYVGPCPPDGEHRYIFKLYALDSILNLSEGATKEDVYQAMEGHILEQAELVGRYTREK